MEKAPQVIAALDIGTSMMRLVVVRHDLLGLLDFEAVWPTISSHPPTPAVLDGLSSPKLAETRALLEALVVDQGRKVVVFSQWRRMLELVRWVISDVLDAHGLRALFFSGQERPARRTQNIVDFHDDDRARVLLCTDAGGVGLNLQRAASAAVCLELPWNPAVLEQRIARVHRLGQTQPVDVYVVASAQGIEARIAQIVAGKQALFRELFDGTSDEIAVQGGGLLAHVRALAGLDEKDAPAAHPAAGQPAEARDDADRPLAGPGGTGDAQSDQTAPGPSAIGDVAHVEHVDDDGSDDDGLDDIGVDDVRGEEQATRHDDGADRGDDDGADRGDHPEARERRPGAAGQGDGPAVSPALTPVLTPTAVAALFAEVRFVPRADGGLTIDAPPAAARGLAALLGGLGALFAHAAGGDDPPEGPR